MPLRIVEKFRLVESILNSDNPIFPIPDIHHLLLIDLAPGLQAGLVRREMQMHQIWQLKITFNFKFIFKNH